MNPNLLRGLSFYLRRLLVRRLLRSAPSRERKRHLCTVDIIHGHEKARTEKHREEVHAHGGKKIQEIFSSSLKKETGLVPIYETTTRIRNFSQERHTISDEINLLQICSTVGTGCR